MNDWIAAIDLGDILLAIVTIVGGFLVAWLTVRGNLSAAKENASATRTVGEGQIDNSRIEILLQQYEGLAAIYQRDRAEDAAEIAGLKIDVKKQGIEIDDLKARLPKFRAEIRRLRHLVTKLHGDPGPWLEDLD